MNNQNHRLSMALVVGNDDAVNGLGKLLGKGVCAYFLLAGKTDDTMDERIGYCSADLMLYAQTLGLNTWWIGGMINQKKAQSHLKDKDAVIRGVLVVGYGRTQGVPHHSKTAAAISSYDGVAPDWFKEGVDAVLLAPTAINRQGFSIKGKGNQVSMACNDGFFSQVDLGIGKYHFELGAGSNHFEWA